MAVQWLNPLDWHDQFSGSLIGWGAFWIILGLSVFLMVPVASAMSAFFVDDVARAVEERHYPNSQAQHRSKLSEEVRESLGFLGTMLVANLIALIFYALFTVFAPIILVIEWIFNWTRVFLYAAKRHLGRNTALSAFRDHRFRVWMCGVILVLPMSVPLLTYWFLFLPQQVSPICFKGGWRTVTVKEI